MGKEFGRDLEAGVLSGGDGLAELQRVPVDDDRGPQVEASDSVMLAFLGSVVQFAALVEIDGALQGMMRLALVQAVLGAAAELLPGSNCLNHTNRVTLASTVSSSRFSSSQRSPCGSRSIVHRGRQDRSPTTACIDEPAPLIRRSTAPVALLRGAGRRVHAPRGLRRIGICTAGAVRRDARSGSWTTHRVVGEFIPVQGGRVSDEILVFRRISRIQSSADTSFFIRFS